MLNRALYARGMKGSARLFALLCAVITLYVCVIIAMYDPTMMAMLDGFVRMMPRLMAAVGMRAGAASLLGFMVSYLYGFVLLLFPMLFAILRANALIARLVDDGSMVALVAAPVKRRTVAFTQAAVLTSGLLLLVLYITALERISAEVLFPGELDTAALLRLNAGLLGLHLFIGGVCFLSSCAFSDARYSVGFGAGIPALMAVLQMLANMGAELRVFKYLTFFSLFDASGIVAGESGAAAGVLVLFAGAMALYALGIAVFSGKDLHI